MNKLKISFIITSIVVVAIATIWTIALGNDFSTNSSLAVFISAKVLFTLLFICGVVYALISNAKTGSSATIVGIGILFQFIPLIIRLLVRSEVDNKVAYSWTIVLIALALFSVLVFGLSFQDKLMVEADKKSAANEIPVQAEKRLATDENND